MDVAVFGDEHDVERRECMLYRCLLQRKRMLATVGASVKLSHNFHTIRGIVIMWSKFALSDDDIDIVASYIWKTFVG